MSDTEKGLNIKITTTADTGGVKATDDALKELQATTKTYSKEEVESLTKGTAETAKWTAGKKDAQAAMKGLSLEVPILGRAWAFISNPISASITAITGGLALWRYRMQELQNTFASFELPDLSRNDPAKINAAAEAWDNYREKLGAIRVEMRSIESSTKATLAAITQTAQQLKQLRGNEHPGLDAFAAREKARAEFETNTASGAALVQRGKDKAAEAAGIRIAGADVDAQNLADMKAQAEAAQAAIDKSRTRLGDIAEAEGGDFWSSRFNQFRGYFRYGQQATDFGAQREIEQGNIATAQAVVDRYNARSRAMAGRNDRRAHRDQLFNQAPQDIAEGSRRMGDAATDWRDANTDYGVSLRRAGVPIVATPNGAGATVTTAGAQRLAELEAENQRLATAFGRFMRALGSEMESFKGRDLNRP